MEWVTAETQASLAVSPATVVAQWIVLPSVVRTYTDPTLIRTRGPVIIVGQGIGVIHGAWGILRWDDIDDTVPTALERPSPFSNPDLDWINWGFFANSLSGAQLNYQASIGGAGLDTDSRAMRRLGNRAGVMFVIEVAAGLVGVNLDFGIRCLLKE